MKFVKRFRKVISILFLLLTIEAIVEPTTLFAWVNPIQPEYTSYEKPGATDSVNLLTGDFTYSIPLLEVPGPDGGFSVPLTYNAGIGLEQESSWVGLGWTLNVGAITRQTNEFPDDAAGENQTITAVSLNGLKGWTTNTPGLQIGWNNLQGFNGALNLGFAVETYSNKGGLSFKPIFDGRQVDQQQVMEDLSMVAMGLTIAGLANSVTALASENALGLNAAMTVAGSLLKSTSIDVGTGARFAYKHREHTIALGLVTNYWYWLDATRTEQMYGTLHLSSMPTISAASANNLFAATTATINGNPVPTLNEFKVDAGTASGVASDVNYYIPPGVDFSNTNAAASVATDNFEVKAAGISGTIRPYPLEVGSVSVPRQMDYTHIRLAVLPYKSYTVPFIYDGLPSNSYLQHTGTAVPTFNYGLDASSSGDYNMTLILNDGTFNDAARIRSDVASTFKIPSANHIETVTNWDRYLSVHADSPLPQPSGNYPNGFIDYFSNTTPTTRTSYTEMMIGTGTNGFGTKAGIGGFSITGANGLTYHFAIPSLESDNQLTIYNWDNSINTTIKRSQSSQSQGGYANTWLLTGITGPDFVDRNSDGAIDDGDWGHWIRFNYYEASIPGNYWAIPSATGKLVDEKGVTSTNQSGAAHRFYLNSIETRSHIALFIKDPDYLRTGHETGLRLAEIALLKRSDYQTMVSNGNIPIHAGTTLNPCTLSQFYANNDFNQPNNVGTIMQSKSIRRIRFNHTYELRSTNPSTSNMGSRTLKRVSVFGSNGTSVVPDFKFAYASDPANNTNNPAPPYTTNPAYNADMWDGWGMYNSNGTSLYSTHSPSSSDADGSAWSLSRITTPEGAALDVNYERDSYSSIGGLDALGKTYNFSYGPTTSAAPTTFNIANFDGGLAAGDLILMNGQVSYSCNGAAAPAMPIINNYIVQSVSGNTITLTTPYQSNLILPCGTPTNIAFSGTVAKRTVQKGGGTRVSMLTLQDQGVFYKTRYLYSLPDGRSAGVVAQEPAYSKTSTVDFNTIPGYPMTPVLYSQVSVLTGNLSTDSDYNTRTVYQFETPNINMFGLAGNPSPNPMVGIGQPQGPQTMNNLYAYSIRNEISDYSSKIGALKSVNVYDVSNSTTPVGTTSYVYTSQPLNPGGVNNYQGLFSSGVIMHDVLGSLYKMTRTTTIKYPYLLQKVVSQKDGFTTETDNLAWDFISGQVVEQNLISSLGLKTKHITVPAYTVSGYSQMGPKALNIANKNMVAQSAAEYDFKLDVFGNIAGLTGASATTWSNSWSNYRDYDPVNHVFSTGTDGSAPTIWRKNKSFVYYPAPVDWQSDGSVAWSPSNQFDFTLTSNPKWMQTSESRQYNRYSVPVESYSPVDKMSSCTKTDLSNSMILASASNANYNEFAYSGAEDGDGYFFGGEVALSTSTNTTAPIVITGSLNLNGSPPASAHSGQNSVQVAAGNKSFIYKPLMPSAGESLMPGRTYRAQVWTNSPNGAIYYSINGGSVVTATPSSTQPTLVQVGVWYKVWVDMTIPTGFTSFEVGVTSMSGLVNFDDFKFHPLDAAVTANVYDATTGYLTFTLGNDNLYTRYYYDNRGVVMKTYVESIKYNGERLVSERKDDMKRFHTNQ